MNNDANATISSSDSDEEDEEVTDGASGSNLHKRNANWCGTNTEDYGILNYPYTAEVTWPPQPSSAGSSWPNLRPVKLGNPLYGTKMQLYSKTDHNLAVYADGDVRGTMDDNDLHTHLELLSVGHPGHVRIQGILTKLYICMDCKGRLYGEPDVSEEGTVFIEDFQGSYNTYLSRKFAHLGWYIGIKKNGKVKRGPKTTYKQKAVHFLPRRSKFE